MLSLKELDFLSRDQIATIHNLGKVRNTNRILKDLSIFLSSYREEYSTVYYLNALGRDYVGSEKVRRKNQFVNHVLMRNDFYIYMKCPVHWENEIKVKDEEHSVICDSLFTKLNRKYFLEVDSTQKMKINREKVKQYLGLYRSDSLKNLFSHNPGLIWITTTELRRQQLRELCKDFPIKVSVYTINDIK